jgi:hypothetical protein
MQLKDLFSNIFKIQHHDPQVPVLLKDVVRKYPFFAVPHFFLLRSENPSTGYYNHIAARTSLFFDNPYLLQLQLDEPWEEDNERFTGLDISKQNLPVAESAILVEQKNVQDISKEEPPIELPAKEELLQPGESAQQPLERVDVKIEPVSPEPMLFEPLFATDYFASQGIKLSEEVQSGDKLGKQLKSFTEWLKSMKKVHDEKQAVGSAQIDLAVQNLAEKSNLEEDVLTESMAEAYLLQGKRSKAVEIYEKLSLLNPAKSAYFAAKIDAARSK